MPLHRMRFSPWPMCWGQSGPSETDAIRESYLQAAAFVGRQTELAKLQSTLAQAKSGQGAVCLLGGESGVGKSRLLDEFRTHALVNGWQVLMGQEIAEGGSPFQLWQAIVSRLALNTELNDLDAGVLQEIVPTLGTLLEREIPAIPQLSGEEGEQRIVLTMLSLVQQQDRPTLLLLEDLHWSTAGLAPLKQMLQVLEQLSGVMVVGSYRNDERPHLPNELPGAMLIQLERLNDSEIAQLSGAMLGESDTHANLVSLLTHETEGNTFFIVEVMRALAEDAGQLREIGQTKLPTEIFTSGMEALLQRRLNKVTPEDRMLMQLAAVAGRQIDLDLLALLMPEVDIHLWLERVSDAAIFIVREGQWFFSHDKLRQATLTQLTPAQRKDAHRRVATAIEHLYRDDAQTYISLLAHWQAAEDDEKELQYLLPVVHQMIEISGNYEQGLTLVSRGLALLSSTDRRRVELLNLQADVYEKEGHYDDAERVVNDAYALAKAGEDAIGQATSLNILGIILREQGRYSEAYGYFQEALAIAQAANDIKNTADSLIQLGVVAEFQKRYTAAEDYFRQSLALRQTIDDPVGVTQCFFYLGMLASQYHNDFDASLDYAQQNLAIFQQLGNQRRIAQTYTSMGIDYASTGQYEIARDYFERSLAIRASLGDKGRIAHTYLVLGESYFFEGVDYKQALHYTTSSLQIYLELNALAMIGIDYGYITLSHIALGDYEAALQAAVDHFELQSTIELDKSNGLVHTAVAKILAACETGQVEVAGYSEKLKKITGFTQCPTSPKAYIEEAVNVSTIAQIRMVVLIECGQLALQIGQPGLARLYLTEAKTMAEQIQNQHKLDRIESILSQLP
ncbi:MAG: tetratricopeptide repeat protein [Chloroflexota bacterium]